MGQNFRNPLSEHIISAQGIELGTVTIHK